MYTDFMQTCNQQALMLIKAAAYENEGKTNTAASGNWISTAAKYINDFKKINEKGELRYAIEDKALPAYEGYLKKHPYTIPGGIAAGTGLLASAASGNAMTGVTTALGAVGGWYGGQHLADKYSNEITNWTSKNIGKDYAQLGKAVTPILTAGAGSLLGAMLG